jgi:hypothetical protein
VCPTHQKFAKLCVVKDTMKDNYGRPFLVCSERKNPCKFWQWGDVFEGLRPLCQHGMVCCERKSRKMVRIKTVCFTAVRRKTLVVSSNGSNKNLV